MPTWAVSILTLGIPNLIDAIARAVREGRASRAAAKAPKPCPQQSAIEAKAARDKKAKLEYEALKAAAEVTKRALAIAEAKLSKP